MNKWERETLEKNYEYYFLKQGELINTCKSFLINNESISPSNILLALEHLERIFWKSSGWRKIYWTATHHWWSYSMWKTNGVTNLSKGSLNKKYLLKNKISKELYFLYKEQFMERDKEVQKLLSKNKSKYSLQIKELKLKKEYFENLDI